MGNTMPGRNEYFFEQLGHEFYNTDVATHYQIEEECDGTFSEDADVFDNEISLTSPRVDPPLPEASKPVPYNHFMALSAIERDKLARYIVLKWFDDEFGVKCMESRRDIGYDLLGVMVSFISMTGGTSHAVGLNIDGLLGIDKRIHSVESLTELKWTQWSDQARILSVANRGVLSGFRTDRGSVFIVDDAHSIPRELDFPENVFIHQIASGYFGSHLLMIDSVGHVFSVGANQCGQRALWLPARGNPDDGTGQQPPNLIHSILQNTYQSLFDLNSSNSWLVPIQSMLGNVKKRHAPYVAKRTRDNIFFYKPMIIASLANDGIIIDQVACGANFSCFRSTDLRVYTCGNNGQYVCGHSRDEKFIYIPSEIDLFRHRRIFIKDVDAGMNFCVCLDTSGRVWIFGNRFMSRHCARPLNKTKMRMDINHRKPSLPSLSAANSGRSISSVGSNASHLSQLRLHGFTSSGPDDLYSSGNDSQRPLLTPVSSFSRLSRLKRRPSPTMRRSGISSSSLSSLGGSNRDHSLSRNSETSNLLTCMTPRPCYVDSGEEAGDEEWPSHVQSRMRKRRDKMKKKTSRKHKNKKRYRKSRHLIEFQDMDLGLNSMDIVIQSIHAGARSMACLDTHGRLWTFGDGTEAQMGNGLLKESNFPPNIVPFFKKEKILIDRVICGAFHTFVRCDQSFDWFAWGSNDHNEITGVASQIMDDFKFDLDEIESDSGDGQKILVPVPIEFPWKSPENLLRRRSRSCPTRFMMNSVDRGYSLRTKPHNGAPIAIQAGSHCTTLIYPHTPSNDQ